MWTALGCSIVLRRVQVCCIAARLDIDIDYKHLQLLSDTLPLDISMGFQPIQDPEHY